MKTVFINSPVNGEVRNLLRSDFYSKIKQKREFRFIFFVSKEKLEELRSELSSDNIIFELVPNYLKYSPRWSFLWQIFIHDSIHTLTIKTRQKYALLRGGSVLHFIVKRIAWFLGGFKIWRSFLRWFDFYFLREDVCWKDYFEKYNPDFVFAPALMIREDTVLLKAAKRRGVKSIGMVRSWDNLSSKLFLIIHPDKLLVKNEMMSQEAFLLHDYPKEKIIITGFLQWSHYLDEAWYMSKDDVAKILNLPTDLPWITYFGGPPFTQVLEQIDKGDHILMLKEAMSKGDLPKVQIIIKNHPVDKERIQFRDEIKDVPVLNFGKDFNFKVDDNRLLLNLIRNSDVIINFATSVAIEAAILDIPIVAIGFNGYENQENVPWEGRLDVAYDNTIHTKYMMESGGVWRVKNKKEFIEAVSMYLKNKNLHRDGRVRLANLLAGPVDGLCEDRVLNSIIS
jgi:tRNA-binding EMAP/Myf-like protein